MSGSADCQDIILKIKAARAANRPLRIKGGDSKKFLGADLDHLDELDISSNTGIVHYEPSELIIQLRSGTTIAEAREVLDSQNQMFAFEPPVFSGADTIGGVVATGISGSRRVYAGATRDYVLGTDIINGLGELSFGGQVMKNVAGYDVSRMMVGSMGCFGVITEVSLKVLPKPELEETCVLDLPLDRAYKIMLDLFSKSTPVSASAFYANRLYIRFSGAANSVKSQIVKLGGERDRSDIWERIDSLEIFDDVLNIWRISVSPGNPVYLEDAALVDWGGGQRWLTDPEFEPRTRLDEDSGGHATLIRGNGTTAKFHPLNHHILEIHKGLKKQFDPGGILNPGKMYSDF